MVLEHSGWYRGVEYTDHQGKGKQIDQEQWDLDNFSSDQFSHLLNERLSLTFVEPRYY